MLSPIILDGDWTCETHGGLKSMVSLTTYQLDALQNNPAGTRFRRVFVLDATDYCVNYVLQFDSIPSEVTIFINDERLNPDPADPLSVDITAYVALGDNEIMFHVERESVGLFGGVRLQPVPCE